MFSKCLAIYIDSLRLRTEIYTYMRLLNMPAYIPAYVTFNADNFLFLNDDA